MTRPIPFGVRYGRLRLDGDLDEFHRAISYLGADTCQWGWCDPQTGRQCTRHQLRAERRRQRERWQPPTDVPTGGRL